MEPTIKTRTLKYTCQVFRNSQGIGDLGIQEITRPSSKANYALRGALTHPSLGSMGGVRLHHRDQPFPDNRQRCGPWRDQLQDYSRHSEIQLEARDPTACLVLVRPYFHGSACVHWSLLFFRAKGDRTDGDVAGVLAGWVSHFELHHSPRIDRYTTGWCVGSCVADGDRIRIGDRNCSFCCHGWLLSRAITSLTGA